MPIVTEATYKTYKGITASTYDAQLAVIVPRAIDDFQTYTGRTYATATFTEKHNGTDSPQLVLNNRPVASLTSVTITSPSGLSVTVPTTALAFDAEAGTLKFDPLNQWLAGWWGNWTAFDRGSVWTEHPVFPRGHQNVTVVYVAGYADGSFPAGAQGAIYDWIDVLLGNAVIGPATGAYKRRKLGNHEWERRTPEETAKLKESIFGSYRRMLG